MKQKAEHLIKVTVEEFEAILNGSKTFTVQENGQEREVGDLLVVRENESEKNKRYTGRFVQAEIVRLEKITDEGPQVLGFKLVNEDADLVLACVKIERPNPEAEKDEKAEKVLKLTTYNTMTREGFDALTEGLKENQEIRSASIVGEYPPANKINDKDLEKTVRQLLKKGKRAAATKAVVEALDCKYFEARRHIKNNFKGF